MLAHLHGQVLNMSSLANSLGVSSHTVRKHIDLLEGAFMARRLPPWSTNFGKRLVKSPKLYLRDTGILHALLRIETKTELLGHPVIGTSWESLCLENILAACKRKVSASFYRTAAGAEVDLVLESGSTRIAVEFKASSSPRPQRGFWSAVEDLGTERNWIIAPVSEGFPLRQARVASLDDFLSAPENADVLQ
jgi:predicted AAA+ superfamily ATPase